MKFSVSAGASPGTVRLHSYYLGRFAALHYGEDPFQQTVDDLAEFLAEPGWAPETRKSARAALRSFYRWAFDTDRIITDPSAKLPAVHVPAGKPRPAPENAVVAALGRANPEQRLMVMLAAFAGLRCCEIARIHTTHVENGVLRVFGKGGKQRLIPLHPALLAKIPTEPRWLFPSPYGGHLRPNSVSVILGRLLKPYGYTAHTLRHRFASRAYAETHDLRAVQELLGHAKPETTQRYTLVPDDALRAAVWAACRVTARA